MIAPEIPPPDEAAAMKPAPAPVPPIESNPPKGDPKPAPAPVDWKTTVSKEGHFTVLMPTTVMPPKTAEEKEPFGPMKTTRYFAPLAETKQVYIVVFGDLPDAEAAKGYEAVCKKMLADMNKHDKATKVANEKKITLGAAAGMEYRLESGPKKGAGEISQRWCTCIC